MKTILMKFDKRLNKLKSMNKQNPYFVFLEGLLKELRLSANGFQEKYNIRSFSTILNKLKNDPDKRLHPETIGKLESALNIKINDDDLNKITYRSIDPPREYETLELQVFKFPIISKVFAGASPMLFESQNISDHVTLPYEKKENCFAVRVVGDSMNHIIEEGDTILVDMDKQITNGSIVIARLSDSKQIIKRYRELTDNQVMFYSDNGNYKPIVISKSEIEAIYKVVGIWKQI